MLIDFTRVENKTSPICMTGRHLQLVARAIFLNVYAFKEMAPRPLQRISADYKPGERFM